jgi:hypothetical protein
MAWHVFVRVAGGLGVLSLALFLVGVAPFLNADPTAGAGLIQRARAFSVNHELKGDRLSLAPVAAASPDVVRSKLRPAEIPVGCEASFSPISAPRLAYIYGRCMT